VFGHPATWQRPGRASRSAASWEAAFRRRSRPRCSSWPRPNVGPVNQPTSDVAPTGVTMRTSAKEPAVHAVTDGRARGPGPRTPGPAGCDNPGRTAPTTDHQLWTVPDRDAGPGQENWSRKAVSAWITDHGSGPRSWAGPRGHSPDSGPRTGPHRRFWPTPDQPRGPR
jgi:hypothetical protein